MNYKLIDRIMALGNLISHARLAYIEADNNLQISSWNQVASDLFGYSEDDTMGCYLNDILPINRSDLINCKTSHSCTCILPERNGQEVQCEIFYTPIISTKGEQLGIALLAKDISSRVKDKASMKRQKQYLEDIYGFAPVGIYHVDLEGNITSANPEYAWILGYETSEAIVEQITDFAGQTFFDEEKAEEFLFGVYEAEQVVRFRCRLKRKDNSFIWALCYAKATHDESGRMDGFNGFSIDISDIVRADINLKEANEKLKELSIMDGLTRIPNRRRFDEFLCSEWNRHFRGKNYLSIILCDIDFFKFYNDTYGHQAGDECLKKVALAIQEMVHRSTDLCARYGGEEFVVILPCTDAEGAMIVAEKIRMNVKNLEISHENSKVDAHITLSLGVATMIPTNCNSAEELVALADKAMYKAKENGRNQSISIRVVPE